MMLRRISAIDFQNTNGNHGGFEHGEHNEEVGAQRAAAVNGGSLFDLERDGLDKAHKHEDGETGTKPEIDNGDGPWGVELETVSRLGEGEHDHLERNHHGENTEVIDGLADDRVDAGNIPCSHGCEEKDEPGGEDGNESTVNHTLPEGIVTEGHALEEVLEAGPHLPFRDGKGVGFDERVDLEGIEHHGEDREHVDHTDDAKHNGENGLVALLPATRMKNRTAFACATP